MELNYSLFRFGVHYNTVPQEFIVCFGSINFRKEIPYLLVSYKEIFPLLKIMFEYRVLPEFCRSNF